MAIALERYVDESAVILMFLSKGYFTSRNCLREVVSALDMRKPLTLVHETDLSHGGQPLDLRRTREARWQQTGRL